MELRTINLRLNLASFLSILLVSTLVFAGVVYLQLGSVERQADQYRQFTLEKEKGNLRSLINLGVTLLESEYGNMQKEITGIADVAKSVHTVINSLYYYEIGFDPTLQELRVNLQHGLADSFPGEYLFLLSTSEKVLGFPGSETLTAQFGGKPFEDAATLLGSGKGGAAKLSEVVQKAFADQDKGFGFEFTWMRPDGSLKEAYCHVMYFQPMSLVVGIAKFKDELDKRYLGRAMDALKLYRAADGGSVWLNDTTPRMIADPLRPELDGTDLSKLRDKNGVAPFMEMVRACLEEDEAFLEYGWPKPGGEREYPKLAYAKLFRPWDVVLGTGVYLDVIDAEVARRSDTFVGDMYANLMGLVPVILVAVLLVVWAASRYYRKIIGRPIGALTGYAECLERGDLDAEVEEADFQAELSTLRTVLVNMVDSLKTNIRTAEEKSAQAEEKAQEAEVALAEAKHANNVAHKVDEFSAGEVAALSDVLARIAAGDLTARYETSLADKDTGHVRERFAAIQVALNETVDTLAGLMTEIRDSATSIDQASRTFNQVAGSLLSGSDNMSDKAGDVASATDQISMNINTMASSTEEMSVNVSTVSTTAEEMSQAMSTVNDSIGGMRRAITSIAQSSADGSQVASEAKELAEEATRSMTHLGSSAAQIGKVTEVIKRIAEQTNLLALNATIEAASAGEAGRGFAVVAGEIKELANQSAKAAEDIAAKIRGVQENTGQAVGVIAEVAQIIDAINEQVSTIEVAVSEQTEAADQISLNVSETAKGTGDIAHSIAELAKGAGDISRNAGEVAKAVNDVAQGIFSVNTLAKDGRQGAQTVHEAVDSLARMAEQLKKAVGKFTVEAQE